MDTNRKWRDGKKNKELAEGTDRAEGCRRLVELHFINSVLLCLWVCVLFFHCDFGYIVYAIILFCIFMQNIRITIRSIVTVAWVLHCCNARCFLLFFFRSFVPFVLFYFSFYLFQQRSIIVGIPFGLFSVVCHWSRIVCIIMWSGRVYWCRVNNMHVAFFLFRLSPSTRT